MRGSGQATRSPTPARERREAAMRWETVAMTTTTLQSVDPVGARVVLWWLQQPQRDT
jgi:hypothetical protein